MIRTVVLVDGLGPDEGAEEPVVVGLAALDEADHAVDRGNDGLGVERLAVVERDALVQRELPGRVVDLGRQVGGQAGGEVAVRGAGEQGLVDVVVDRPFSAVVNEVRIEAGGFGTQSDGDLGTFHRCRRVGARRRVRAAGHRAGPDGHGAERHARDQPSPPL